MPVAVTGDRYVWRSNGSIPSACGRRQPPWGLASHRRTSFHLQRCGALSHRTTRHQTKCSNMLKVCFATACLK
jgi:hypothetical protein